jgi:hypothetical protein
MKLLNCTVRLGGNLLHSVPKERVSEREIMLLKHIHGSDAIVDLKHVGDIEVPVKDEYRRLARFYGLKNVEECFDVKLENFAEWLEEQLQNEEAQREERKLYDLPLTTDVQPVVSSDNIPRASAMLSDEEFEAEINRRALEIAEAKVAEVLEMQAEQAEQARIALEQSQQQQEEQTEQTEQTEKTEQVVEKAEEAKAEKPAKAKAEKAEATAINLE